MEELEKPKDLQIEAHQKDDHTADMVDHYWGSIGYVTALIKASELKAGLLLSFYGILLNFIVQAVITYFEAESHHTVLFILIGLWFFCTAASIYYCVRCFIPKIEGSYDPNIFFFGDVISKFGDIKQFAAHFYKVSLDEDQLFVQMGEQIYIISKIAAWKFKNVKRALRLLGIGLALLFITLAYYVFTIL